MFQVSTAFNDSVKTSIFHHWKCTPSNPLEFILPPISALGLPALLCTLNLVLLLAVSILHCLPPSSCLDLCLTSVSLCSSSTLIFSPSPTMAPSESFLVLLLQECSACCGKASHVVLPDSSTSPLRIAAFPLLSSPPLVSVSLFSLPSGPGSVQ